MKLQEVINELLRQPNHIKGQKFEHLLVKVLPKIPDTEIEEAWRYPETPRNVLTSIFLQNDGTDIGTDIVAKRKDGDYIAIQAKCFDTKNKILKNDIHKFAAHTALLNLASRWVVTTGSWTTPVEKLAVSSNLQIINVLAEWGDLNIDNLDEQVKPHELDSLQRQAFDDCVSGFKRQDRGQLIMACGTGKTLVSQRIAEEIVPDGGLVIYATPSIGLTAQSRREWLREAKRPITTVVVCSDTAAGRGGVQGTLVR